MLYWIKITLDTLFTLGLVVCAIFDWRARRIPDLLQTFLSILGLVQIALLPGMDVFAWPYIIVLIVTVPLYFFCTMIPKWLKDCRCLL